MGQLDPRQCEGGRAEGFESEHRSAPPLDRPMVLLDDVVQVAAAANLDRLPASVLLAQQSDSPMTGYISIQVYCARPPPPLDFQQPFSRRLVPPQSCVCRIEASQSIYRAGPQPDTRNAPGRQWARRSRPFARRTQLAGQIVPTASHTLGHTDAPTA